MTAAADRLRRHLSECGWPVVQGHRGWVCNAPALHDDEHRLHLGPERAVVARAAGYWAPTRPRKG